MILNHSKINKLTEACFRIETFAKLVLFCISDFIQEREVLGHLADTFRKVAVTLLSQITVC
jgi:hypothetical protein